MSKTIVVTGGTRGIGLALAEAFLRQGNNVVICGRSSGSVLAAEGRLAKDHPNDCILGVAADVSDIGQVRTLWEKAVQKYGRVDIWINNAGLTAESGPLWVRSDTEINRVVATNVTGVVNGCKVAVASMIEQGHGSIYNMEGLGSSGPVVSGTALYSATKAAVTNLTKVLVKDTAATKVTVGFLSPGMVTTDLLLGEGQSNFTPSFIRVINILADRAETVAPYLAGRILKNTTHGAHLRWLTGPKIAWRFMTAAFRKNRLYNERGARQ